MDKPLYDSIRGLAPTISIEQKAASGNPRSTVGTITEIHDYLRVLWARVGRLTCHNCGRPVSQQSSQQIVHEIAELPPGTKFLLLAPLVKERKGEHRTCSSGAQGRLHPRARGRRRGLARGRHPARQEEEAHDRRGGRPPDRARPGMHQRLNDSVETALRYGQGTLVVAPEGEPEQVMSPAPRLPPLRHLVPRAVAPALLVQLAAGHVPRLLGPGHAHGDGPRAGGPEPRPVGQRGRRQAAGRGRRGDELGHRHRARGGAASAASTSTSPGSCCPRRTARCCSTAPATSG